MPVTFDFDTKMFVNQDSGGLFVAKDAALTPGKIFWVCSNATGATDSARYGKNPGAPFATLDFAIGQCTDSRGDVIYVMPGHAETVATAGALDLDKIGLTIIGIGNGTLQPTITLTDAASDVDVDAASITVENLNFVANDDDVLVCLDVNADDFTIRKCRFTGAAVTKNFHVCIQDAAATASDRITVEDCHFLQIDAANTSCIKLGGTGDGHIIRRNIFIGDWTVCIDGSGVVTLCIVVDNVISNAASDVDGCIKFAATATGIIMRNLCCGAAAQANGVTATAMAIAENYYGVISEDLSAILDPIAT